MRSGSHLLGQLLNTNPNTHTHTSFSGLFLFADGAGNLFYLPGGGGGLVLSAWLHLSKKKKKPN
jgi:hypothetical protein